MPTAQHDRRSDLPQIVLGMVTGVGLTLMVAGIVWSWLVPPAAFWDEEQAAELEEATVQYHALTHTLEEESGGPLLPEQEEKLGAARRRAERAQQDLAAAQFARGGLGRYLTLVGSLLVCGGAIALYVRRHHAHQ